MNKIVIKKPDHPPEVATVDSLDLPVLQSLVEGYIEAVTITNNIILICNEEGKLLDLPYNFSIGHDYIVGTAVFVSMDNKGDFIGLTDEQIQQLIQSL